MKIQLVDLNKEMVEAWQNAFQGIDNIDIIHDSAFNIPTECVVSPANSFGIMSGGFDAVITRELGQQVQENVQELIKQYHNGELLVGQALYTQTDNSKIPYLISAPTMRTGQYLGSRSVNVYLAAKAIFLLLKIPLPFKSVSIPGLGTGVGKVPFDICAHQMRAAYDDFYLEKYVYPKTNNEARKYQEYLCKITSATLEEEQNSLSKLEKIKSSIKLYNELFSDDAVETLKAREKFFEETFSKIENNMFPGPTKL